MVYPPNISNLINTTYYMNIEKLNQYTEEQIAGLSNEDNQLRLIIKEQPNVTKLKLLKKAIVNEMTEVTLVISSNDNNLIDFSNFECINNNVIGVESYNYGQMLKSIRGISIFENLRKVVIEALYDNKLCINELALLGKLEELNMSFYPVTKYQYPALNKLNSLKRLTIKGLDSNLISRLPNLKYLTCLGMKSGTELGLKMPNLLYLNLYRSTKISNLDFLLELKKLEILRLVGLSNIIEIPDLDALDKLTRIQLLNMKRLMKMPKLNKNIKNIDLTQNIPLFDSEVLRDISPKNYPQLQSLRINLGNDKKSNEILDRFKGICKISRW